MLGNETRSLSFHPSRDGITGGVRVAGCFTLGQSSTVTTPRNGPCNGISAALRLSVCRRSRGMRRASVLATVAPRDGPRPRAAPVTTLRTAPRIPLSRHASPLGAVIAREARASWGDVALLVLRTPSRGVTGTPAQAAGDKIAPPPDAKPVLLVQKASTATRRRPSHALRGGRRGVEGRGVDQFLTLSIFMFISGSVTTAGVL